MPPAIDHSMLECSPDAQCPFFTFCSLADVLEHDAPESGLVLDENRPIRQLLALGINAFSISRYRY